MQIFIAIGAVLFLIILYVGTGILNDKTKIPEGCEQAYIDAQSCESCSVAGTSSCSLTDPKLQETLEFMKEVKL